MPDLIHLACIRCDREDCDGVYELPRDWRDIEEAQDSDERWKHLGLCPRCAAKEDKRCLT